MTVFLVEDEWVHAEDIRISIENLGHEWLGYSSEGFDAVAKIKQLNPDVILLDLMLHGARSGTEIADYINKEIKKPFIFLTSVIDEKIIEESLKTNPVAYLTKPVNEGDLKAALIKVKTGLYSGVAEAYDLNDTEAQLLVRVGNNLKSVDKTRITFIETAEKNYCTIHVTGDTRYTVKKSLTTMQDLLSPKQFYRVHKEYLINLLLVTKIDEGNQLVYVDQHTIPIGNNFRAGLLQHFNIL